MFHSIRWRLVASYVFLAVVTVSVLGIVAIEIVRNYAYQREVNELTASADAVAQQALPMIAPVTYPYELSQLVQTTAFLGNVRVRILDRQDQPLVDSGQPGEWNEMVWIAPPEGSDLLSPDSNSAGLVIPLDKHYLADSRHWLSTLPPGTSATVIRKSFSPWGGRISFGVAPTETSPAEPSQGATTIRDVTRSQVVVTAPIGPAQAPIATVEISDGPNYAAAALATTEQAVGLAGGGAAFLAALIGLFMGSRLASPLRQLSGTALEMGSGNLEVRSPIASKDEIGDLAACLNQMAEQLQVNFKELETERDTLRRFIADASHELRTPITAIKNFNDLLLGPAAGDTQVQNEFLVESQAQIDRLEWITQNLLNLSRIDAGLVQLNRCDCDVSELMTEAVAPFKTLAAEKHIELQLHLPQAGVRVNCDPAQMELVLSNLLDNAIKYTPAAGRVEMGVEPADERVRLWVQDSGPGILADDLPHIFDRFYRGRNTSAPGNGLGLSIVTSLVQAHGGRVWVESEAGNGARFILEF